MDRFKNSKDTLPHYNKNSIHTTNQTKRKVYTPGTARVVEFLYLIHFKKNSIAFILKKLSASPKISASKSLSTTHFWHGY